VLDHVTFSANEIGSLADAVDACRRIVAFLENWCG